MRQQIQESRLLPASTKKRSRDATIFLKKKEEVRKYIM
jgi:hypothetical protein